MAPTKKKVLSEPRANAAKKHDQGVKRPGRGFHRFRNSMLNVKPKGAEIKVVQQSQKSSLLRLPPELRTAIWAYVLGNNTLHPSLDMANRTTWQPESTPSSVNDEFSLDLFRTCRQIFQEASQLPFSLNTFRIPRFWRMRTWLKTFKPSQRTQISKVEIQVPLTDGLHTGTRKIRRSGPFAQDNPLEVDFLPRLKHVSIPLKPVREVPDSWYDEVTEVAKRQLGELLAGREVGFVIESFSGP